MSEQGSSAVSTRGICWSATNNNPTTADNLVPSGTGVGAFTGSLPNVTGCGTTYYYRAYATNSYGTSYGSVLSINSGWPLVSSVTVNSLDWPNASLSATVSSDCGITQKGFVWNVTGNPIVTGYPIAGVFSQEGPGVGNYSSVISQLLPNVTYKIRAYAQNEVGLIYGPEMTITMNAHSAGHYLGESFAGGTIFYLDESGQHGMVWATYNVGPPIDPYWASLLGANFSIYGCPGISSNSQESFGSGQQNTANMLSSCSSNETIATYASDYVFNGFGDWFVPSKEELNLAYQNLALNGLGNFQVEILGGRFWSSSQTDVNRAWILDGRSGMYMNAQKDELGGWAAFGRPIRIF